MSALDWLVAALLTLVLLAGIAWVVLRATARTGPHRDIDQWSVTSPAAVREREQVRAALRALEVEAAVMRRDYEPPPKRDTRGGGQA